MAQLVASSLLSTFVTQHCSDLKVLGSSSSLIWLAMDGRALTIQRSTPDSQIALPTSIFLAGMKPLTVEQISLRDGRLSIDDSPLLIQRWWRPPRAPLVHFEFPYSSKPIIEDFLGRGRGLTPEGDDVLAGWLVAARSIGHPAFKSVRAQILSNSPLRTTTFSAALLQYAALGYGIAPLIDYVKAILQASKTGGEMRMRLARVGHTSGEALALGVEIALGIVRMGIDSDQYPRLKGATA